MAAKETLKAIKDVTLVTAAGAAEGAILGTVIGTTTTFGALSIPGGIAGGVLGGATALSAELVGRRIKQTVTVHGKDTIVLPNVEKVTTTTMVDGQPVETDVPTEQPVFSAQATLSRENVPLIQVPDTIRALRKEIRSRTTGKLQGERTQAAVLENAQAMTLVYMPRQKGATRAI